MLWVKRAVLAGFIAGFGASVAAQEQMTAGSLTTNMNADERISFLAGIVEGLATARYYADDKQPEGRKCIYDWFYRTDGTLRKVYAAFDRYPDQFPGPIMAVLIRSKCGG